MTYYINYNTIDEYELDADTLEEAKAEADEGAAYTQRSIEITDEHGEVLARREWWGVEASEEDEEDDIIEFGSYGFYGPWYNPNER